MRAIAAAQLALRADLIMTIRGWLEGYRTYLDATALRDVLDHAKTAAVTDPPRKFPLAGQPEPAT